MCVPAKLCLYIYIYTHTTLSIQAYACTCVSMFVTDVTCSRCGARQCLQWPWWISCLPESSVTVFMVEPPLFKTALQARTKVAHPCRARFFEFFGLTTGASNVSSGGPRAGLATVEKDMAKDQKPWVVPLLGCSLVQLWGRITKMVGRFVACTGWAPQEDE